MVQQLAPENGNQSTMTYLNLYTKQIKESTNTLVTREIHIYLTKSKMAKCPAMAKAVYTDQQF